MWLEMTSQGSRIRTWCAASTAAKGTNAPKEVVEEESSSEEGENSCPSEEDSSEGVEKNDGVSVSCITEAQLSPDATCVFTADYARKFCVYPFTPDISAEGTQQKLVPYAQFPSADPIWAFTVNPYFDVNDRNTTTVLVSRRDQYIGLHNALWDISQDKEADPQFTPNGPVDISSKLASYKLVDKLTEAVTAPISLAWSPCGSYFYAGQRNQIAIFDLTYTDDPIAKIRTIPSNRNKLKGGGWGFKGDVSALSPSPANAEVLAVGTRTRYVGLYDTVSAQEITHFALPGTIDGKRTENERLRAVIGEGVTQLKWSPDGTYVYVAERNSDAVLIYDVRNFSLALAHCAGRQALTRQKMGFDIWTPIGESHEVWAGGTDGRVRVWRNPYLSEGAVEADEVIDVGKDPVSDVLVHPYGHAAVVAKGKYEVGNEPEGKTITRGGLTHPMYSEWGCLDILGLGSY